MKPWLRSFSGGSISYAKLNGKQQRDIIWNITAYAKLWNCSQRDIYSDAVLQAPIFFFCIISYTIKTKGITRFHRWRSMFLMQQTSTQQHKGRKFSSIIGCDKIIANRIWSMEAAFGWWYAATALWLCSSQKLIAISKGTLRIKPTEETARLMFNHS